MSVKIIKVKPLMTDEEADKFAGQFLSQKDCKMLITYNADVVCKETGNVIAKFRKNVIPVEVREQAYEALLPAASLTDSRGIAAGKSLTKNNSTLRIRKDGSVSAQTVSHVKVYSGVVGFSDRSSRFPYCRLTAYTRHHFDQYVDAYPIVKMVDNEYKRLMPKEYKKQREMADNTAKDFIIPNTSFTTVTVNKNYVTAIHKDSGDYKEGFGNLVALRKGKYEGGNFVVFKWGVGFDLQNGDLLLVDVHQWHGNTPMIKLEQEVTRLSLVMYYRENMIKCGTAEQELKRVRNRKTGDEL